VDRKGRTHPETDHGFGLMHLPAYCLWRLVSDHERARSCLVMALVVSTDQRNFHQ